MSESFQLGYYDDVQKEVTSIIEAAFKRTRAFKGYRGGDIDVDDLATGRARSYMVLLPEERVYEHSFKGPVPETRDLVFTEVDGRGKNVTVHLTETEWLRLRQLARNKES